MTVSEYASTFYGKPVVDFHHGDKVKPRDVVYRLSQEYEADESQVDLLDDFLAKVNRAKLEALVIGAWSESFENGPQPLLDRLTERAPELTELKALFVGDITSEDAEISWIHQGDYSKLLRAFPLLEVLCIRGTEDLKLPPFEHHTLRELTIQCGGLPTGIVRNLQKSTLPALRHLELWLGDDSYGFDGKPADYAELLKAQRPERLHYLGLRNAQISDELAAHIATQPWLGQLHTLDLSMGTLGDAGAKALLESPHLPGLKVLDLRHHYISEALVTRLRALPLQLRIDKAQEEDDGDRYVEVAE
jgi:hypothetical protein